LGVCCVSKTVCGFLGMHAYQKNFCIKPSTADG
jgi:hypothetical protein